MIDDCQRQQATTKISTQRQKFTGRRMGNAESGPEVESTPPPPQTTGRVARATTSSLLYSGGKAKAVASVHDYGPSVARQKEDIRQPKSAQSRVKDGTAQRTESEVAAQNIKTKNSSKTGSLMSAATAQIPTNSQYVKFHSVPVEKMRSPVPSPRKNTQAHQMTHDMEIKNSILQSMSDDYEDTEVGRLSKAISNLGTEVIEATAAVYHYMETHNMDDEMTVSGRSQTVLNFIKKAVSRGDTQPAYKFLETAKAVTEILKEEEGSNIHASDANEQNSVTNQTADVFRMLEETGSLNGGGSVFRVLCDDEIMLNGKNAAPCNSWGNTANVEWEADCLPVAMRACSPRSQRTQKARGGAHFYEYKSTTPAYIADKYVTEAKSTAEESEDERGVYTYRDSPEGYPAVRAINTSGETQLDLTDLPHLHNVDADMDLEFVEHFDAAFNEFIAQNPDFLAHNPELLHNLRILKLQKFLEFHETTERNLTAKKQTVEHEKEEVEENMHSQLKQASQKKAARQTFLQSELNNLSWSTKRVQAHLRWKFLEYSEDRAKRQFKMRQQFRAIPQAHTRKELVALIPDGAEGKKLRDTLLAAIAADGSKPYMMSSNQTDQLRELQAENSVMSSELAILQKKLTAKQAESRKCAWVESVLVRMDEGTKYKLKNKYQKKEGVSSV
ncbi:MAG: hypothetical protein SGILL_000252 [Bacillariaceae sp.]